MAAQQKRASSTEYQRKWRAANREKVLASKRKSYLKRREAILEGQAKRRLAEGPKLREIETASRNRRKAVQRPAKNARQSARNRLLGSGSFLFLEKELRKIYSDPCFFCGSTENQSIDHIIPLSKGGSHSIGNVMTLCLSCNTSKRDKLFIEWKLWKKERVGG